MRAIAAIAIVAIGIAVVALWSKLESVASLADLRNEVTLDRLRGAEDRAAVAYRLALAAGEQERAVFEPSTTGFQRIGTETGAFLVSLKDVAPFANGYKIRFEIGNPNNADYSAPELEIRWGSAWSPDVAATWEAQLQTATKKDPGMRLRRGAWTSVSMVAAPARPEQISYFDFRMRADSVSLFTR